ncbi:MAG: hypothetical protein ACOYOP_00500 [Microthrixaceae bacterium]
MAALGLRRSPRRAALLVAVAVAVVAPAACSDGSSSASGDGSSTTAPAPTTAPTTAPNGDGDASGHGGHSQYGSAMAPAVVSTQDVAKLGPGPQVGQTFSGNLGLNVCGRFLEPPVPAAPVGGATVDGAGRFTVAPTSAAEAGHAATVGELARAAGIDLATGSVSLPTTTKPGQVDLGSLGSPVATAGRTLRSGDPCGKDRGTVQLWVYSKDAVDTGKDVRMVVTDPERTPVVEDGMAFVIAFSPESSLPTLPPSVLAG